MEYQIWCIHANQHVSISQKQHFIRVVISYILKDIIFSKVTILAAILDF